MALLNILLTFIMAVAPMQQPSFLDTLRQKSAEECLSINYEFAYRVSGVKSVGNGTVDIQGNAYHMLGNGVEIFCDGTSTWVIDEAAGEVVIESADSQDAGYMANPVIMLMNIDDIASSYKVDGNTITLELSDGSSLEIKVKNMIPSSIKKTEDFRPPYKFDSKWIVTDLR